ncbi:MAG TPA: formate dehydrogenase subunit alpha [Rhodanobacteraceae bacterium]|nr:formate dehydrogenase subunit alpha [Rhodanobacteraceae bacterium]
MKQVTTVCPYCGVGCRVKVNIEDNHIVGVNGAHGPTNEGRLCVKGRYGFDYYRHPNRLTKPLIRRKDAPPKSADLVLDPANPLAAFREASWDEALDFAGNGLARIRDARGPQSLVALGCAKGSNEEAYLVQKLVRTGFHNNNIDHCTRLCHAGSVVALGQCIGSGAVTLPVRDVMDADCVFLIGSNPTVNHPVAATWIKNAIDQHGLKLIIGDPRLQQLSRRAFMHLQFTPDADVSLLNAMIYTIINEGLTNDAFIRDHTEGFEDLKQHIQAYSPEAMAPICGIAAEDIKQAARTYATAKNSMIIWGMGSSQSQHGSDNVRCIIALAMLTGQVGRRGAGLHPIRGQNNVQGASDMGLMPGSFPDYKKVADPAVRARFEKLWGCSLSGEKGLTSMEMMDAILADKVQGMYIMGENPAMSDANAYHARKGLAHLEHLVVQDIFLTEAAYNADVVLPASVYYEKTGTFTNTDRWVQMGRQAIDPPGEVRQDLWIIQELAHRLGLDWHYQGPAEVFNEIRQASANMAGITWERLERESSVVWPCKQEGDPGEAVMFTDGKFNRPNGRALFVPCEIVEPDERPDADYPFVLLTGRQLEHWHTGTMTRRSEVLNAIEPDPVCYMNPADLADMGVAPGEPVTLKTRRNTIVAYARADTKVARHNVFMAFCYYEAAANLLTNPTLDPEAKIPSLKYCGVRVSAGGVAATQTGFNTRVPQTEAVA